MEFRVFGFGGSKVRALVYRVFGLQIGVWCSGFGLSSFAGSGAGSCTERPSVPLFMSLPLHLCIGFMGVRCCIHTLDLPMCAMRTCVLICQYRVCVCVCARACVSVCLCTYTAGFHRDTCCTVLLAFFSTGPVLLPACSPNVRIPKKKMQQEL